MVRRATSQGDLAAWFEGDELVVYDTVRDSEVQRSTQEPVVNWSAHEHLSGNGFQHVSVDEVVWRSEVGVHRLDMATGEVADLWEDPYDGDELSQPLQERGPGATGRARRHRPLGRRAGAGDQSRPVGPASCSRRWNLKDG